MANRARSSRDEWIEAGYELLGEGGPAAVRIDEIARRLGVSRSGFYHRFENWAALFDAINDRWLSDGFDAYVAAGALSTPVERLRGIGYFGLGNERLRRADQWLLVRGPRSLDLGAEVTNVRERALEWVVPHFVDLGFDREEAERRAYAYYVAYLGLGADLGVGGQPVREADLRRRVDTIVDLLVNATPSATAVDELNRSV